MNTIEKLSNITKNYTALCVEDDEKSRAELQELFGLFFKKVYIAKDGVEGFEIYNKYFDEINIIFTDIYMPLMDGFELIKMIKEINPLEYIVIITAHQDLDIYKKSIDVGINDILIKPIVTNKIISILEKATHYIKYTKEMEDTKLVENSLPIDHDIYKDSLTQIENKNKLDLYLNSSKSYHLILVNIDNFDFINSKYGYAIGDEVIQKISKLLQPLSDENCHFFRVVSDEFAFLFSKISDEELKLFITKIIHTVENNPIQTAVDQFILSCTVGVGHGKGEEILRNAHIAIKETRQIGKDKFGFYSTNSLLLNRRENNLKWLKKIKNAIKSDAIIPYFQPIYNNKTGKIESYEALARIIEMNRISKPYYYLENAKLFKLLPNITKVMVAKVFKKIENKNINIAINLALEDLADDGFITFVLNHSSKYNIKPSQITFDIIESVSLFEDNNILKNISLLNTLGFKISIDDFGTNHTNMQNFQKITIDSIKIDGYYIENILKETKSELVIKSMISCANSMHAKVIAESVSSKEIQEKVVSMGIEYSQGYFIGKPSEDFA